VLRARIVLGAAEGKSNNALARELNTSHLRMCRELGFAIAPQPHDPAVMLVRKTLATRGE
jgi:hypothetical protein